MIVFKPAVIFAVRLGRLSVLVLICFEVDLTSCSALSKSRSLSDWRNVTIPNVRLIRFGAIRLC